MRYPEREQPRVEIRAAERTACYHYASRAAMRIKDSIVLVTGASEGIGAACVHEFRQRGARVALVARNQEKLKKLAGPEDLVIQADLTVPDDRQAIVSRVIEHFGRIDILVNNAGVGLSAPAWRAKPEDVRRMFELNFFAAWELSQQAAAEMRQKKSGMIVNIGSVAGKIAMPWFTLYSSTKFALGAMTNGMRMELEKAGIRTMLVCPGFVRTDFHHHVLGGPAPSALKRGRPAEVTAAQVATAICDGVERNTRTVVVPKIAWVLVAASRLFPAAVDRLLTRSNAEYAE